MTIFRFSLVALTVVAALGIYLANQRTMAMSEIMASDLEQEHLEWQFGRRLEDLSADQSRMRTEMSNAGFVDRKRSGNCGSWEYPKGKDGRYAFAQYCDGPRNAVELLRFGIGREPLTYD